MKKLLSTVLSVSMLLSSVLPIAGKAEALSDDIVILYTNDVHTYIDGALSYDVIAAVKDELLKEYKYVILPDAGDHIQGTAYGSMDKGESIIKLMNAAGYDVATLGNHEFDYGMEGCLNVIGLAEFEYVSANFYNEKNGIRGENVLDEFVMFDCGGEKLAVIGITTPETFSKSTPAYFQDENGDFIYGISAGGDGALLCTDIQNAIDNAKKDGATRIIALGHLGVDPSSQPWTSKETIAQISGIDAFIDGHSHTVMEGERVKDKDGKDVLLAQTGQYFSRIGMMVIDSETDEISTDFIECEKVLSADRETVEGYKLSSELYGGTELISNSDVNEIKKAWIAGIDEKLGEKIGTTELTFDNYDAEGIRLVRSQETNSGAFAADALYYLFDNMDMDVDVAVMNGGGVRNRAITGEITYKICKDMHTFGNVACLQTVSGQQILDALEWGARNTGIGENGGFLHVSGLTYKIDTTVPNTVKADEMGVWKGAPEEYRVHDVKVYNKETGIYEALDVNASYNMAGYNYTLRDLGDGYAMFDGAVNVLDYVMEDYMVLANYIKGFGGGVIGATNSPLAEKYPGFLVDYSAVEGSGRIVTGKASDEADFDDEVWVGGVQVTKENKDDVLADGGSVKYNPETDTLTLTDATIINEKGHGIYAFGINLTVHGIDTEAEGSNTILGKSVTEKGIDEDGDEYSQTTPGCGIYSEGNGYSGNGGLIITGVIGNITAEDGSSVNAYEDIVISGTVGDVECTGGVSGGIDSAFGSVIIEKSGVVGNIASENDGISADEDVTIAGRVGRIVGNGYAGIHTAGGDVTISGKVEKIIGCACGIDVYKNVDLDDGGNEVYTDGGAVISGTVGGISGGVIGIHTDSDLDISGTVKISVTDADTEEKRAISAGGNIITPEGKDIITQPEGHKIKSVLAEVYEVEVWHNTVCDSEGKPALTVEFKGFTNPFADVDESDWFYGDVEYAVVNGLFCGIDENTFAPDRNLTRAMLVAVLYRNEGMPAVNRSIPFADVDMSAYYADAVLWAKQNGIVSGVSENEFAPNDNIKREQIAAIMHRYAVYKKYDVSVGENTNILSYDDFASISEYAIPSIQYATGSGLMKGKTESTINPKDCATRAEAAAILHRFTKAG